MPDWSLLNTAASEMPNVPEQLMRLKQVGMQQKLQSQQLEAGALQLKNAKQASSLNDTVLGIFRGPGTSAEKRQQLIDAGAFEVANAIDMHAAKMTTEEAIQLDKKLAAEERLAVRTDTDKANVIKYQREIIDNKIKDDAAKAAQAEATSKKDVGFATGDLADFRRVRGPRPTDPKYDELADFTKYKRGLSTSDEAQAETARHNRVMEARPVAGSIQQLIPGRDVPLPAEVEEQRKRLNARALQEGRPVVSGDANKIADYDTSIDDLKTLRGEIPEGTTGTSAKVGAMLPDFVTDITGLGTEAKQKQATIDRVKQVIGKALEGGVLRKEDEIKYEKILPKIADTAAVVKSKLDGLEKAIDERRATLLDSLEDAGYEVSKYHVRSPRSRGGVVAPAAPVNPYR